MSHREEVQAGHVHQLPIDEQVVCTRLSAQAETQVSMCLLMGLLCSKPSANAATCATQSIVTFHVFVLPPDRV